MQKLVVILSLILTLGAFAGDEGFDILTPKKVRKLLGDFPKPGSIEERIEFDLLLHYQNIRTQEVCAVAAAQDEVTLENLFVKNDGPLSLDEARELEPKILAAYAEAGINILIAKKTFNRPRPYDANPAIIPCVPKEKSKAYPSGHTALVRLLAHVLSELYPERAAEFMARADQVALNRIIGGVHHPSDIESGNRLGDYLADQVKFKIFYQ